MKPVILNNIDHPNLTVITRKSAEYGDDIPRTLTFPTEYEDVQREYPILIRKHPETGEFESIVCFGFESGENLFLTADGWQANYIPVLADKGPFMIGLQKRSGQDQPEVVVQVDIEDPRVDVEGNNGGERVFLDFGGNAPYLDRMCASLRAINDGIAMSKAMFESFERFELIEPVSFEYKLKNEELHKLEGFYTVSEERLSALDGDALQQLNQKGFLRAAFLVVSSLNNMKKLIEIKNDRL